METAWTAMASRRFLLSSWPWRGYAYLVGSVPIGILTLTGLLVTGGLGVMLTPVVVGVMLLGAYPLLGVPIGAVERWRLRLLGQQVADPHATMPPQTTRRRRWSFRRRERASLRALGYGLVLGIFLWPLNLLVAGISLVTLGVTIATPFVAAFGEPIGMGPWTIDTLSEGLVFLVTFGPVWYVFSSYVVTALAAAQGELAKAMLGPREDELRRNIAELRRSRLDLVDAFETERQRIERHLHDGVQQRLVGLTMTLGLAELDLPEGESRRLVVKAHSEAEAALADLREAVRGIHPRVLIDHGLEAAVREVADRSPLPVSVRVAVPDRLPAPIEAAAYFVVSEGLGNVAKHAQARHCEVEGWVAADRLVVTVVDDGVGGADPAAGTGINGLVTRLDALGGTLDLSSPAGGPTRLRMECPCRLDD